MALPTDSYIDVEIGGDVVDRIGLSAALSDISDIISSGYCGMNHLLWRNGQTKTTDADYTVSKTIPVELSGNTFPITVSKGSGAYNYPDGMFCGIVWLYSENSPMDYCINSSNISDYKLVTEWDAPHYVYKPSPLIEAGHWTGKTHLSWFDNDMAGYVWNNGYNNNFMRLEYWDDNEGTNVVNIAHIRPYLMYQNENGSQFLSIYDYSYQATFFYADTDTYAATTTLMDYTNSENIAFCVAIETLGSPDILPATGSSYGMINAEGMSVNDQFGVYLLTSSSIIAGHNGYFAYGSEYAFHFKDDVFTDIAGCGLKFYTDKLYKPIISNGVVIAYTDDMDEESELDEWTGTTDHGIGPTPPTPPGPGDDDDNTDPISTADAPFGAGIAHYYAMTADSVLLQHVSEALSTWDIDSSKKDLYRNLISCKLVKPPAPIPVSGSEDFTIYGVVPQYQGAGVKLPVINGNPSNTFGPYTITRKFNDFRDFAPYSKAEIFLPYCGWTALPSHVIGRSVTVKYFTDIIAATCKAVVFCNNNVVAEAAGIIGLDIPFAAENVGAKMEAANMGLLSSTLGAVQTAVGVGTMVSTKSGTGMKNVTSGLSQVISGCTQISMAGNENWTEINGKAGDGCSLSGITNIIIKITRPKYGSFSTPPYVPSGYAHNIGYVAMKQTKPGNVSGLLVCDNVDTSGISGATQRERELIKAYMESGIIVNAAPSP